MSLLNTLECIVKALTLHAVGNREPLMVSKRRSEVLRDAGFEGLAKKIRAGKKPPDPSSRKLDCPS